MKVYKVVRTSERPNNPDRALDGFRDIYSSWVMATFIMLPYIEYELHKNITPKIEGTPLMAYDSLESFSRSGGLFHNILICEAEVWDGFIPQQLLSVSTLTKVSMTSYNNSLIKKFWRGEATKETHDWFEMISIPVGTIFCKSVYPYRVLDNYGVDREYRKERQNALRN